MKFSVVSRKRKILYVVALAAIWTPFIALIVIWPTFEMDWAMVYCVIVVVGITVYFVVDMSGKVLITENGITLMRGTTVRRTYCWHEVCKIVTFDILYNNSMVFGEAFISVLVTDELNWAYRYRRIPINCGSESISFSFNEQALNLIKQYYNGDIISSIYKNA